MSAFARQMDAEAHRVSKRRWQHFCALWWIIGSDLALAEWDRTQEILRAHGIDPLTLRLNNVDE